MAWFVDEADVSTIAEYCRSRAVGAGVDPFQYDQITARLTTLREWLAAFRSAAEEHVTAAEAAEHAGRERTAQVFWKSAAACAHTANTLPHPDGARAVDADRLATRALQRYAALAGPVHDLKVVNAGSCFAGELRIPPASSGGTPPVVIIVAGLDSSRAEFIDLADALLARNVAVAAIDGPGQGEFADLAPQPAYQLVATAVIDALTDLGATDPDRIGLIGLSLGGLYAMRAALDPRICAIATVSGAFPWPTWPAMPAFAVDTLTIRCGGAEQAQRFTDALAQPGLPTTVTQPLLVVTGGRDQLPTPEQARHTADTAPNGELMYVEDGDHLLGNTRWQWLDATADWVTDQLNTSQPAR